MQAVGQSTSPVTDLHVHPIFYIFEWVTKSDKREHDKELLHIEVTSWLISAHDFY